MIAANMAEEADMLTKLLAMILVVLAPTAAARAGGLGDPVLAPVPEALPTVDIAETTGDWTGFYLGVHGAVSVAAAPAAWGGGVHAGYLSDLGDVVLGGELSYLYSDTPSHRVGGDVILGLDAGAVLPHATAGAAWNDGFGLGMAAGAGVSVLATDDLMVTGRYRFSTYPGAATATHEIMGGVSLRF